MSINAAMQTGVSGLKASSEAVGRISENIANVGTDGYRRSFAHMVTQANDVSSGDGTFGVRAVTGRDITESGAIRNTGRSTDLAISGQGFFAVARAPGETIESNFMMTRAGAFQPDENGFLKNAAGLYLKGFPYGEDGNLGLVDRTRFGDLDTVNVNNVVMQGAPTTAITLSGNLPAQATGLGAPGEPFISSASYYSPVGEAGRVEFAWQPGGAENQWTLTVSDANGAVYGSVDVAFDPAGDFAGSPMSYTNVTDLSGSGIFTMDPATGTMSLSLPTGGAPQDVTISIGAPGEFGGLTQFSGNYQPIAAVSDGAEFGALVRTEMDGKGDLYGIFDNGMRRALYNIPVVMVDSPNNLTPLDGNAYALSWTSGGMVLQNANENGAGGIVAGGLEGSNVEISEELTNLITTQRAYSSNAKVITTADEMLDEALRLKR
jgi:flagellar hook protein FlgE